jgi:hypothetical protein
MNDPEEIRPDAPPKTPLLVHCKAVEAVGIAIGLAMEPPRR